MARLKRRLYEVIVSRSIHVETRKNTQVKFFNFADFWSTDVKKRLPSPTCNDEISWNVNEVVSNHISPVSDRDSSNISSDRLLMVSGSTPFEERRDLSKYGCDTPYLDREVQRASSRGRRRKRGHNWVRRKGSRSKSLGATASRCTSRVSQVSKMSRASTAQKKQRIRNSLEAQLNSIVGDFFCQNNSLGQFTKEYLKKFLNDNEEEYAKEHLVNNKNGLSIKTRFASEIRDKVLAAYEQLNFECPYSACGEVSHNLEQLTEHRVHKHNEMAFYLCEQCQFYYLTQEDLDKHSDIHLKNFLSYCIYCAEEFRNMALYQKHLSEHLVHSFPCAYCDKFFLTKQLCEKHVGDDHHGKKYRTRTTPRSILCRIDTPQITMNDNENKEVDFAVKVLCQESVCAM
ncbi:hypothetical protein FQA39_LY08514 [Lamprigera yunnana]|nr:hypothetical protein FQA39_LY08514 [Lamprigera yunnana]